MAQANEQVRRIVEVLDLNGDAVTGLDASDFTFTLKRGTGGALTTASETVSVSEITTGLYWILFTPTESGETYRLEIEMVDSSNVVSPEEFQIEVTGPEAATGPYLTTRVKVRRALDIRDGNGSHSGAHDLDSLIDDLLSQVTKWAESFCGRTFTEGSDIDERTQAKGETTRKIVLSRWPVSSVTSVHVSTALPRVFGTDELLTAEEDYFVDLEAGIIERVDSEYFPTDARSIKVVYTAGYDEIPADLERAAIEVIATKLYKGTGKLYHLTSESGGEGSIAGVRFDDIPDNARTVFEMYRDERV